jgi:regulatory protein
MKITEVSEQKRRKEKYNIFIDGEFCFSANLEDVIKHGIKVSKEITHDELESLIEQCEYSKAYNYSLNLLSKQDYTSFDMIKKLKSRSYGNLTITKVMEKLKSYGLINDVKYAQKYIKYCLDIKKYGKNKIMAELYRLGLKDIEGLDFSICEDTEYGNLREIAIKKYKTIEGKDNAKQKLYRYLLSKGYDFDLIRRAMREVTQDDNF